MLRTRGLCLKEKGQKEMIIKLDSIEEEGEDGAGFTQRPKNPIKNKKTKMREL